MFAICSRSLKRNRLIWGLPINGGWRVRQYKNGHCYEGNEKPKAQDRIFGKYLIVTNVLSSAILMGIGDLIEQQLEYIRTERHKDGFDWTRNRNLTIIGACQGFFAHFFYKILDAMLPGVEMTTIIKKIFFDQTIASPTCLLILFGGVEILGDRDFKAFKATVKEKFWKAFGVDCAIWIPAQLINFYVLPPRFRVIYVSIVAMCYNIAMSYIIHAD